MYNIANKREESEIGSINEYCWSCAYQPKAYFAFWFEPEIGFHLTMKCYEQKPRAVYKDHNAPVYRDSCLEFFVDFYPEDQKSGYLNFEMNANGALLLCYGLNRHDRINVVEWLKDKPVAKIAPSYWQVDLTIPLAFIEKVYGKSNFTNGSSIMANAYKCGDDTERPHFGDWCKVGTTLPDFHQPNYFGLMRIVLSD